MNAIQSRKGTYSKDCQQLLAAVAFDLGGGGAGGQEHGKAAAPGAAASSAPGKVFAAQQWEAANDKEMRRHVRELMVSQLATPYDVWRALVSAAGGAGGKRLGLSATQFGLGMREALGYCGDDNVLAEVYEQLDDTSSDEISFDEFSNWLNNKPQRRALARALSLHKTRRHGEKPMDAIHWTVGKLRSELQLLLSRHSLSTLDLLMAYDKSADGKLSRREYVWMMRKIIDHEGAWAGGLKEVVYELFRRISGGDGEVDIEELERWMRRDTSRQGPDVGFMRVPPSASLPTLSPAKRGTAAIASKAARVAGASRAGRMEEDGGKGEGGVRGGGKLPTSISLPALGHPRQGHPRRSRPAAIDELYPSPYDGEAMYGRYVHDSPAAFPHKTGAPHAAAKAAAIGMESLGGRALAARWLMPHASTQTVLTVESGPQLPVLLDGPKFTPKWTLLPSIGGSQPAGGVAAQQRRARKKKKKVESANGGDAPQWSGGGEGGGEGRGGEGGGIAIIQRLGQAPAMSNGKSWDDLIRSSKERTAEAMLRVAERAEA